MISLLTRATISSTVLPSPVFTTGFVAGVLGAAVLAAGAAAGSFYLVCLRRERLLEVSQGRADSGSAADSVAPESGQADSGLAGFP